jgi:hypothetical protein
MEGPREGGREGGREGEGEREREGAGGQGSIYYPCLYLYSKTVHKQKTTKLEGKTMNNRGCYKMSYYKTHKQLSNNKQYINAL